LALTRHDQARLRPLVAAAWSSRCREIGAAESDRSAYRSWYEGVLYQSIAKRSTRDATRDNLDALLQSFADQIPDAVHAPVPQDDPPRIDGFTQRQNAVLGSLARKAWCAWCRRNGPEHFLAWFDSECAAAGIRMRSAGNDTVAFDKVMGMFAVIAGDDFWITRTSSAPETRIRHAIASLLSQLSDLEDRPATWDYCRAIFRQMSLPVTIEDAPAALLRQLLQALDTQVRRLLARRLHAAREALS